MNVKLRKRLFMLAAGTGGLAAIGGTVGALVSCGSQAAITHYSILPTYTGQADILLSLGISPDYYPVQLNQAAPYPYVIDPARYMDHQPTAFKIAFLNKMKLLASRFKGQGRSWWNQDAEKANNANVDPEYWTHMDADLFMYEQYLLDDSQKAINPETAPTYKQAIKTNFRSSKDPYTRLSKDLILKHDDRKSIFYDASGNVKPALVDDLNFADSFYSRALDASTKDDYYDVLIQQDNQYVFNPLAWKDKLLAGFYNNATLNEDVKKAGLTRINYLKQLEENKIVYPSVSTATPPASTLSARNASVLSSAMVMNRLAKATQLMFPSNVPLAHHPIYESQAELGEAPAYEGALRDNSLYLYTVASDITKVMNESPNLLKDDLRRPLLVSAQENAKKIIKNLKARQDKIKTFFQNIGVAGKTFAMVTIAPGQGQDTIQTDSKYAFLYRDIGLNYPWPSSWTEEYARRKTEFLPADATITKTDQATTYSLMNLDDNGWFFDVTKSKSGEAGNIGQFKNSADFGVITVRDENWNNKDAQNNGFYFDVFKSPWRSSIDNYRVDYDLWNEGIKMPAVLHMVLDKVVSVAVDYAEKSGTTVDKTSSAYKDAFDWGDYWTKDFIS